MAKRTETEQRAYEQGREDERVRVIAEVEGLKEKASEIHTWHNSVAVVLVSDLDALLAKLREGPDEGSR